MLKLKKCVSKFLEHCHELIQSSDEEEVRKEVHLQFKTYGQLLWSFACVYVSIGESEGSLFGFQPSMDNPSSLSVSR